MPYLSANRYVAFGYETAWGSVATPTVYLQVDTNPGTEPQVTYLDNKALYGSPAVNYGVETGVIHTKFSAKGNFFTDTGPQLIFAALGVDTVSGTASPYTHTLQLKQDPSTGSQPSSLTLYDIDNVAVTTPAGSVKQVPGCVLNSLSFSGSATGAFTYSADFVGSELTETAPPTTPAFSTALFLPAYTFTAKLDTNPYAVIEEFSLDLKRNAKPVPTLNGSPAPYVVWADGIDVTGKLTIIVNADDPVYWEAMATGSHALTLTATDPSTGFTFTFTLPSVQFKTPKLVSSKEWEEVQVDFQAIAVASDAITGYSPLEVACESSTSTAFG